MTSLSLTWLLDVPVPTLPPTALVIPARENYTSTEVDDAVRKLVQGAIRRPYGALGERKTGDAFNDTMDAAAGVFLLTSGAPFYVLLLGAKRLQDFCASVITDALDLLDCINNTGRRVRPLTSLTSLGNARTALQALESASATRQTSFENIARAPAFVRFDKHTDRFLKDAAGAIKVGTEIVQTPQQARNRSSGLVSSVTEAMAEVQRRVQLLQGGIDNYNSLQLPALLAKGVIGKAREVLQARITQLEGLSPTARLQYLRDTTLDVLAGKAVVKGFGSLARSGEFVPVEGVGVPFTDADHLGTAARVSSTLLDPYTLLPGANELTFTVDGGPTEFTLALPQSFIARLEGTTPEPFIIDATNHHLTLSVTGFFNLVLTIGDGTYTVEQMASVINTANAGLRPITAEPYFNPERFVGTVLTQNLAGPLLEFVKTGSNWSAFGVIVGDKITIEDGVDVSSVFQVTISSLTTLTATLLSGTASVQSSVTIRVGPESRCLRIRISDAGAAAAVDASLELGIPVVTDQANLTLGFFPGMLIRCRRTRADEVATGINGSLTASVAGVPRISAETTYVGTDPSGGRGEPSDPTRVVSSLYRAFGDVTAGTTITATVAGALAAGVRVGHILTLRTAAIAGQVGRFGALTAVSDTSVTATMNGGVNAATGLDLEFGLDLNQTRDQIVRVEAPSPLAGDYRTLDPRSNPTEVVLDRPLPISFLFGGQGLTFQMSIGSLRVDFESRSTSLDSRLELTGSALSKFFLHGPDPAIGSTPFVLLANDPRVLGVGDVLELYSAQYQEPEQSFTIIGFENGQKLLELDRPMPNSFTELDFTVSITTAFARIRKIARNNYDAFKVQLGLWLALDVNQTQYFRDLNRFLNPLIVNENPTLSAINTAKLHVQTLVQALQQLQSLLAGYQVGVEPKVDTLIDSFLSRGSDRAVDTLLEGRFTDFFGYNSEEVSYLGNTLERMREVSRLDLPVRRTKRKEVINQERSLGAFEEPDFEFDQSDTQDFDEVDIPGSFIEVAGGNF